MLTAHSLPRINLHSQPTRHRPVKGPSWAITMAFQPVVDLNHRQVFAHEALVRGPHGEGAGEVLAGVSPADRSSFDRTCWVTALKLTARLGGTAAVTINARPTSLTRDNIRMVLAAAGYYGLSPRRLVLEVTEEEETDIDEVRATLEGIRAAGVRVALDDLGAGYAGLNLLADLSPDIVKLDRGLIHGIDASPIRRSIVRGVLAACRDRDIRVIAEGVETADEMTTVQDLGVRYAQGYFLARPALEALPPVTWPNRPSSERLEFVQPS